MTILLPMLLIAYAAVMCAAIFHEVCWIGSSPQRTARATAASGIDGRFRARNSGINAAPLWLRRNRCANQDVHVKGEKS